jgi:hypothetical protein
MPGPKRITYIALKIIKTGRQAMLNYYRTPCYDKYVYMRKYIQYDKMYTFPKTILRIKQVVNKLKSY